MGCCGILLRNGREELLILLRDHIALGQSFTDGDDVSVRIRHLLLPAETEHAEDLLHESGVIGWEDAERVTHFIRQARIRKIDLEVAGVFGRALTCQLAVGLKLCGKGILAGIESVGIGGHRFRIKGW